MALGSCAFEPALGFGEVGFRARSVYVAEADLVERTRKALGFTDAIYMIGWCYLHGTGVALDRAEAKRWYQRAAAKGDQMAVKVLEVLARDTTGT